MEKYFIFPISDYWLSCDFQEYKGHQGIDIGWKSGGTWKTDVWASKSGLVVDSNYRSDSGNYVVIEHIYNDGTKQWTRYLHLDSRKVNIGDIVQQGDVIGIRGNTGTGSGPHLHFQMSPVVPETQLYNRDWCASHGIDPKPYLYLGPNQPYLLHSTLNWLRPMPKSDDIGELTEKITQLENKITKYEKLIADIRSKLDEASNV